jgi:hypothetical protein
MSNCFAVDKPSFRSEYGFLMVAIARQSPISRIHARLPVSGIAEPPSHIKLKL